MHKNSMPAYCTMGLRLWLAACAPTGRATHQAAVVDHNLPVEPQPGAVIRAQPKGVCPRGRHIERPRELRVGEAYLVS